MNNTATVPHPYIKILVKELDDDVISSVIFNQSSKYTTRFHYKIPCCGSNIFILMRTYQNEGIRCKIWMTLRRSSHKQKIILIHLIKLRAIFPKLMSKIGHAVYSLLGKK